MEEEIVNNVLLLVTFLSIAVFSSMLLNKIKFPYTIGLVVIGFIVGFVANYYESLNMFRDVGLSPGIILYIILPTLIFDAALNINITLLKRNLVPILILAVFGLLISTVIIGLGVSFSTNLTLLGAIVFGALISATDPVAVIALFNEIGAPKRLITLIDGESIFNDATAIVLFSIIIGVGTNNVHEITGLSILWQFISTLVGGILVGSIIGVLGVLIVGFNRFNLFVQITMSLVMAYVSFIVANEIFGVSGVMATLLAGIFMRSSFEKRVRRSKIEIIEHFWEYFSFIANSLVFLLLGLTEVHIFLTTENVLGVVKMILIVIPIVLLARMVAIYTLIPMYNYFTRKFEGKRISFKFQTVLFWGGLRGAVPVALVLAIPETFPQRELIIHFTFAIILFTLLFQGTTIKFLMDKFGIRPDNSDFLDKEIIKQSFDFGNEGLSSLLMGTLYDFFGNEGFFIRERETIDKLEYLMKREKVTIRLSKEKNIILLETEPKDEGYFKTVLYEALLELDKSVSSIKSITDPKKMKDLVKSSSNGGNEQIEFNILKYISKDRILNSIKSTQKEDIIRELIYRLVEVGSIPEEKFEDIYTEVIDRENSMSTALGGGIAIPHAKSSFVDNIIVLLGISSEGLEFDSIDGEPVHIFVLILSPKNQAGPHLQVLSTISTLLSNSEVKEKIILCKTPENLYSELEHGVELYREEG